MCSSAYLTKAYQISKLLSKKKTRKKTQSQVDSTVDKYIHLLMSTLYNTRIVLHHLNGSKYKMKARKSQLSCTE